ncbi:hypothetical protein [Paludisphaera mucosa]|uniref:Uncharacterized protein n=1 Tax=Paludisphaera mucosa TaxID=3030827 RepID=A0ABT6FL50_9BACT|nr:hypothetical protein [Paludisphaera mucosa]MDG3008303.1 hypothetical protein [Paludisphaera mucosa]
MESPFETNAPETSDAAPPPAPPRPADAADPRRERLVGLLGRILARRWLLERRGEGGRPPAGGPEAARTPDHEHRPPG